MKILVQRTAPSQNTTIGNFIINDGQFQCYCLEPVDRGLTSDMTLEQIAAIKIPGVTAQPSGTYSMDWYFSPVHGIWLPRILNVPGFLDDEIHIGNFAKDTKGCTLLGSTIGIDEVLKSRTCIETFYALFKTAWNAKELIQITYERSYVLPIQYQ